MKQAIENAPDLWDICARNHGGNELSQAANRMTKKSRDRLRVMTYLNSVEDATGDEMAVALGMPSQTISARLSELKRDGSLTPTTKRPTRTGCMAQAWKPAILQ